MKYGRIIKIALYVVVAAFLVVVGATLILNSVIQKRIRQELTTLSPAMQVQFSSAHINLLSSSVSLDSLEIKFIPYRNRPQNRHVLHFSRASLQGISIVNLLFSKKLVADQFLLEGGKIQLDDFLLSKKDSGQAKIFAEMKWPFERFSINEIELKRITVLSHSLQGNRLLAKGDLAIGRVQMNGHDSVFQFASLDCDLSGINYALPGSSDSIHLQKLIINSRKEAVQIDSVQVGAPDETVIPAINISGFDVMKSVNAHAFIAEKIEMNGARFRIEGSGKSVKIQSLPFGLKKMKVDFFQFGNASISYKDSIQECRFGTSIYLHQFEFAPFDKIGFQVHSARCSLAGIHYSGSNRHSVDIKTIELDSEKEMLQVNGLHSRSLNTIAIPAINVSGFDFRKLLNDHALVMRKIKVHEGRIDLLAKDKAFNAPFLPFGIKRVHVDAFQFKNVSVSYQDKTKAVRFNASANLDEIDIESFQKAGFRVGTILCGLSGVHYSGNDDHSVEIKNLALDSRKETMQINELRIVPQFGKYEFGKKLGHQADRIEAWVSKIEMAKLQVGKLFDQKLFAEKIKIFGGTAHIFRDRRLPRPQTISPLPVASMKMLPVDIRVNSCELANATVEYEEYPGEGYGVTGILRIENMSVAVAPLINHPLASDPDFLRMKVNGSIMGTGTAQATMMMPVRRNMPYLVKGIMENLDLTKLNSSSENLGKIRIRSGFLDFLSFDFTMTEERATGKIIGAYHHLVIQQLKKHEEEKKVAGITSFMLRHLIIPLNKDKSLPERKRTGRVNYVRDPTRFVSFYFLQSLLTGIKASFTLGFLLPK